MATHFQSVRLPFLGETMVCLLCHKTQTSDPSVESQWRAIQVSGKTFYACPAHFPPDGARVKAFEKAYYKFLRRALAVLRGEN